MDRKQVQDFVAQHLTSEGRPLEELKRSKDILKGQENLRLRQFCTSECMIPARDLDDYGRLLSMANLELVQADNLLRVELVKQNHSAPQADATLIQKEVAAEIYKMRWGPTEVPVYNLLGLFMILFPGKRNAYMQIAKYLIDTVLVPVDAPDLSGTRALSHAISTKPALDLEYAQMLSDAGGDVNARNRYGTTVASEIVQIWKPQDREVVNRATMALEWYLSHGGNIDIADGDGMTVRKMLQTLSRFPSTASIQKLATAEDQRRKKLGTSDSTTLARCTRCKAARYCVASMRACQKWDWPRHKKSCKAST
ncbi:hypothetical protein BDZ89DRAFT_1104536 [Hymenopellis radicata]|nr:hypothetical protein BDZ89DRAFT_1104536 [Hymenopellis radicata]